MGVTEVLIDAIEKILTRKMKGYLNPLEAPERLCDVVCTQYSATVCPGSSDPFYVVTYCMKWVNTSWTHSTFFLSHLQLQIINYVADTFQALRNSEHRLRRAYICPLHTALLPQVINFVADFSFFLGCVLRNIRGDERRLRGADQRGVGGPART